MKNFFSPFILILIPYLIFSQSNKFEMGWFSSTEMPIYTNGNIAVAVDGCGFYSFGNAKSSWYYSTYEKTWIQKAPIPEYRYNLSCIAVKDNKIYIPGGMNENRKGTKTLFVYDTTTDTWERKADLPVSLTHHACAMVGDKLYVFGPYFNPYIYKYDLLLDKWYNLGYSNNYFLSPKAVFAQEYNKIYIVDQMLFVFEVETEHFEEYILLPSKHYNGGIQYINGKIYILGGINDSGYNNRVDIYDINSNSFFEGPSMMINKENFGIAFANSDINSGEGAIYVFGGYNSSGDSNTMEELLFNFEPPCYALSSKGEIKILRETYNCNDKIYFEVKDFNLLGQGTHIIKVFSNTETFPENVELIEVFPYTGFFRGFINLKEGEANSGDGFLSVNNNDRIIAQYLDEDDGEGNHNVLLTAYANVDCEVPHILNLQVLNIKRREVNISLETNENSMIKILYGNSCSSLNFEKNSEELSKNHLIHIDNLTPLTNYYFKIISQDIYGNTSIVDNNGLCFNFVTSSIGWEITTPLPENYYIIDAVSHNGCGIYAIGLPLYNNDRINIYFYSPTNKNWVEKEPLLNYLGYPCVTIVNNNIYLIGGISEDGTILNNLYEYNTITNTWTEKAPLPRGLFEHTCTTFNNKIYVFGGGIDFYNLNNNIYVYNPSTNSWINNGYNLFADYSQSSVYSPLDGKIYISGGYLNPNRFVNYDPISKIWDTNLVQLPEGRNSHRSVYSNGKIFLLGGLSEEGYILNTVNSYDIFQRTFSQEPDMSIERYDFAAVYATSDLNQSEGAIYSFGGKTEAFFDKTMEELFHNFAKPCSLNGYEGVIQLDRDYYSCNSSIKITLKDSDLKGFGSYQVKISSNTEPSGEFVNLIENPQNSGNFSGVILTKEGNPLNGDNYLSIFNNDNIYVQYLDANDGYGNHNVEKVDIGIGDCIFPEISNIKVDASYKSANIIWYTNEETQSKIFYGLDCANLNNEVSSTDYSKSHSLFLQDLSPSTTYYFKLSSTDIAGNERIEDNNGSCYFLNTNVFGWEFTTPMVEDTAYNSGISLNGCGLYSLGFSNYFYNPNTKTWEAIAYNQYSTGENCVALIDDKIYIIGGYNGAYIENNVQIYDIKNDYWYEKIIENLYIMSHTCAAVDNYIYIFGGETYNGGNNEIFRYNVLTGSLENLGYNPYYGLNQSAVYSPFDKKIYISGGEYSKSPYLFVAYDVNTRKWDNNLPPLPHAYARHNSIYIDKRIYIFGTAGNLDIYDIKEKSFINGPSMKMPRYFFGSSYANSDIQLGKGTIYAFGGYINNEITTNTMEELILDLPAPCFANSHKGFLNFDKDKYGCEEIINFKLEDLDLVGANNYVIQVKSNTETEPEIVLLREDPIGTGIFKGSIQTKRGFPLNGDGYLSLNHNDTITAIYIDLDDGEGNQNIPIIFEASVDCLEPEISNINIKNIYYTSAEIEWDTNEETRGIISYGISCSNLDLSIKLWESTLNHSVVLKNLLPQVTYYFKITAQDSFGNFKVDDNFGECYSFTTTEIGWEETKPTPFSQYGIEGVSIDGCGFFAIGGGSNNYYYEPQIKEWLSLSPVPQEIIIYCSAVIGNKIYIPGGSKLDYTPLNTLYVYDPENDVWQRKADLPIGLKKLSCASYGNDLYIFGGYNYNINSYIFKYNSISDSWEYVNLNPFSSVGQSAVFSPLDEKIYISGGEKNYYTFVAYDPKTNTWDTSIPPLPHPHMYHKSLYVQGKIYIIGGYANWYSHQLAVDVYDIQKKLFTSAPYLQDYRTSFGSAFSSSDENQYKGALYIFGGWTPQEFSMQKLELDLPSPCYQNCNDVLGDINLNGFITSYDALITLQYLVGLIELTPEEMCRADVNNNGDITVSDASYILQCLVGICDNLPQNFKLSCQNHNNCPSIK